MSPKRWADKASELASEAERRVRITVADGVADVRLVRGEKHNALDWAMFEEINAAIDELGASSGVRAVVLSGDGPSFCSGLDFPSFMAGEISIEEVFERRDGDGANFAQRTSHGWKQLEMPVIVALRGACFGGGLQIALGADIRIAAPDTRLSVMEIRYGLIPDMGLTQTLSGLVRMDVAKELAFSGRIVPAPEALELGLLSRIADDPLAAALELGGEIASRSPHAIRAAKRLLNRSWNAPAEEGLALEAELQRGLLGSPNQIAAVKAELSKEPGVFEDP
jgi:enoyl-CoA hydratase/carnithine racemase